MWPMEAVDMKEPPKRWDLHIHCEGQFLLENRMVAQVTISPQSYGRKLKKLLHTTNWTYITLAQALMCVFSFPLVQMEVLLKWPCIVLTGWWWASGKITCIFLHASLNYQEEYRVWWTGLSITHRPELWNECSVSVELWVVFLRKKIKLVRYVLWKRKAEATVAGS